MKLSRATLALGLSWALACSPVEEPAARYSPELQALLDRCRAAADAAPNDGRARAELALAFEANGHWVEAARNYEQARRLQPDEPSWALHAAICETEAGELDLARASLETAAARFGDCAPILQRHGVVLLELGLFAQARSVFERVAQLEPRASEGWANVAEAALAASDTQGALEAAEHALMLDPSYRLPHVLRGRCLQELDRVSEGLEEIARATPAQRRLIGDAWSERSGEFALGFEARFARAALLLQQERKSEALALWQVLARERPKDVRTLANLAMAQAAVGDFAAALASCDSALLLSPDSAALHAARARVLLGAQRCQEACAAARRASELEPRDASHFELLGFALAACGEDGAAVTAWKSALALDPSNASLRQRIELLDKR